MTDLQSRPDRDRPTHLRPTPGEGGASHAARLNATGELDQLVEIYRRKGVSAAAARTVAEELTEHGQHAAHIDAQLGLDPDSLTNPWHAATSSGVSFTVGALLPLLGVSGI